MFIKYFAEIGQKMTAKIARPPSSCNLPVNPLTYSQSKSFFFKPITATDVLTHINNINPMKSAGPEGIPLKFIKLTTVIITSVLVEISVNVLLMEFIQILLKLVKSFPYTRVVLQIYATTTDPIFLFSPFSKIFEKCIYEQLYCYQQEFKLLSPNQFGSQRDVPLRMQCANCVMSLLII